MKHFHVCTRYQASSMFSLSLYFLCLASVRLTEVVSLASKCIWYKGTCMYTCS